MPHLTTRVPRYGLHKASGQAVIRLNGRDVYLVLFHYSAEDSCGSPMVEVQHAAEPLSAANWPIGSA